MLKHLLSALIASAMLGTVASAASVPNYDPIYITDGQYDAALNQGAHQWRLLPLFDEEVDVTDHSKDCGSRVPIPNGLWYVTQDGSGRPLLIAPSVTPLPPGFPEHVALRACGESAGGDTALFVPAVALDWINAHAGAILIDD
jgi:hypothetical protein